MPQHSTLSVQKDKNGRGNRPIHSQTSTFQFNFAEKKKRRLTSWSTALHHHPFYCAKELEQVNPRIYSSPKVKKRTREELLICSSTSSSPQSSSIKHNANTNIQKFCMQQIRLGLLQSFGDMSYQSNLYKLIMCHSAWLSVRSIQHCCHLFDWPKKSSIEPAKEIFIIWAALLDFTYLIC